MSNYNPWGASSSSDLPANNPFLESSAANRYPALDTSQQFQPLPPYPSQSFSPSSSQFQPYGPQNQWNSQMQLQSPTVGPGSGVYYGMPQQQSQPTGFASIGASQQFSQSAYGTQAQLQSQFTGYPQYQDTTVSPQQYQQHQQTVVAQFDPYNGVTNSQNQSHSDGPTALSPNLQRTGPSGQQHPRQFIQSHKVELESWDATIWKQALLTFEELKRSWEMRRVELQKHLISGRYLSAEDIAQVNGVRWLNFREAIFHLFSPECR